MCPQLAEMGEREPESDEDCEVYFLKPVNEYNIVDRIKEANKELFAPDGEASNGNGKVTKVKFALNLEDYEPSDQQKDPSPSPPDELLEQLTQLKLKPIAEEEPPAAAPEVPKVVEEPPPAEEPEVEEVEEEICEEILDISEVPPQEPAVPETIPIEDEDEDEDDFSGVDEADLDDDSPAKDSPTPASQLRQSTFDQDDSDQKSLTNLLTESDCEEEERTLNEARQKLRDAYKNLYKTLDSKQQATIDRLTGAEVEVPLPAPMAAPAEAAADEEDDLSIIVASYIPNDFELNEQSIYYKKEESDDVKGSCTTCPKATSKTFFSSRSFSFRRRSKPTPTLSSAASTTSPSIRMNYKICCEHRHSIQGKLPRYTGYMSEYGLTAQQLQRRDQQLRRKQRFSMEQTINRNEQELKKMQDNERAFTTWLKNKMRYPINKTRNMFDAHKRRGSVAAAGSPRQHHPQAHPNLHQEQEQRGGRRRRRHDSGEVEVHAFRHLLGSWNK
ncbi:coiled-coil domain-containing protein 181 [Drosophila subpulchrella]|uniref:coiled-coil domain-containing protein 181 n=1 Tax=Drosophila subpulchrella TaxID=1486046 RepID=UPI0018A13742|nr:coiled-coil domain-containing protein 181 [Drosophila subpulchrella]